MRYRALALIITVILLFTGARAAEAKSEDEKPTGTPVCFSKTDPVTDFTVVKRDCYKHPGATGNEPTYECYSTAKDDYTSFHPGDEWVEHPGDAPICIPFYKQSVQLPVPSKKMKSYPFF